MTNTANATTETSHKTECLSYALHVVERDSGPRPDDVVRAVARLDSGAVTCICHELPS